MKISSDDRKSITAEAKRVAQRFGKNRARVEIRRMWVEGVDDSTFNIAGRKIVDLDDRWSNRYNYAEFQKHSADDPQCNSETVMLDVLVASPDYSGEWEPQDWIYPVFTNGKLSHFGEMK